MDYEEAFTQYFYRFLLKVEDPPSVWRTLFGIAFLIKSASK